MAQRSSPIFEQQLCLARFVSHLCVVFLAFMQIKKRALSKQWLSGGVETSAPASWRSAYFLDKTLFAGRKHVES